MEYCSGELMRGFTAWSFVQHCRWEEFFFLINKPAPPPLPSFILKSNIWLLNIAFPPFNNFEILPVWQIFMTEFFIGRTKVGRNSDKNFSSEYSDQVRRNELPLAKILMLPINHKTQISSNNFTIYVVLSSETEIGRVSTYRSTGVIGFNYFDKLAKAISSIEFKVHCKELNCFKGIGRGVVWVWGCKKGWMGVETRWGCQQWGFGRGWGCLQCSVRSAPRKNSGSF